MITRVQRSMIFLWFFGFLWASIGHSGSAYAQGEESEDSVSISVILKDPNEMESSDQEKPLIVTKLPETGVIPQNSTLIWVQTAMLIGGYVLLIGGLISSRSGEKRRVE